MKRLRLLGWCLLLAWPVAPFLAGVAWERLRRSGLLVLALALLLAAPTAASVRREPPSCACRPSSPAELVCEAKAVPHERPRWVLLPAHEEGWGDRARGWVVYLYPEPASAGYVVLMRAGGRWRRCVTPDAAAAASTP